MDLPFYDFFRIFRLERLTVAESIEVLTRLAELRGDNNVLTVVREQPERIHSLHVLTGGNPRLLKMIYRLLNEGIEGDARRDLNRLLEDCTPYFKSRIEEISTEERRVFDHVARHWDPVAVGDIQTALRRPSNKISTYLRRLVEDGFLEEGPGSTQKRKVYQVAERFYNIYYLMRFTRSSRRRLEWLVQAMRVIYSPDDFKSWTEKTLTAWRKDGGKSTTGEREAFLHALTVASDSPELRKELIGKTLEAAWTHDQLECLDHLIDRQLAKQTLGEDFDLIEFFAHLPAGEKAQLGYIPNEASWWYFLADPLETAGRHNEAEQAYRKATILDPQYADPWNGLGILLANHFRRYEEAEQAFRKATQIAPTHHQPWNNLGYLYGILERHREAEEAFLKAIEIAPTYAHPHAGLADLYHKLSRQKESRYHALQAGLLNPTSIWPLSQFVIACGNDSEAWRKVLPKLLLFLDTPSLAPIVPETALRGIELLLSRQALTPRDAITMIEAAGNPEPLADVVLALRSIDDPGLLDKVSPEVRTVARDFIKRIQPAP
jgi:tetratricopeptide (TPR) repeat protein